MSGTKFDQGKAPISLIPKEAIIEEAKALDYGAKKYGVFNFRQGIAFRRLIDASLRHIFAVADGEDIDEESGCYHAACARANLGMLLYMMKNHKELDDRYKKEDTELSKVEPGENSELNRARQEAFAAETRYIYETFLKSRPSRDRTTGRNQDGK